MDNPFSKYFSGESPISTVNYEPQDSEDFLSAGEVLGRPSAKNTAQRGMSASDQMREAYKSLMGDEYFKPKDILSRQSAVVGIGKPSKSYLENIANQKMVQEKASMGRGQFGIASAIESLSDPKFQRGFNLATTRGASKSEMLMHTDVGGRVPLNAEEWTQRGLGGFISAMGGSGAGAGMTQAPQTSTSNISKYGDKPTTLLQSSQGFVSKYGRTPSEEESRSFGKGEYAEQAHSPVMMGDKPLDEVLLNYKQ